MHQQKRPIKFDDVPGKLPQATVPKDVDLPSLAAKTVETLAELTETDLTNDAIWRDYLSLSGSLRTFCPSTKFISAWRGTEKIRRSSNFRLVKDDYSVVSVSRSVSWVDIGFTFKIHGDLEAHAAGYVSVVPDPENPNGWRIWMLRTWLENFVSHGHPDELQPISSMTNEISKSHGSAPQQDYAAIIVGGGQMGLSIAGRLQALNVPYLLVERTSSIGQVWADRYESVRWHTSKEYGNLPFDRTFLPEDDYMPTGKSIGSGFKRWSDRFGIHLRLSTSVENASFDDATRVWTVTLRGPSGTDTFTCKDLVLAIGGYAGIPVTPHWPGREQYKGASMHSTNYKSSEPWRGKRGIVVGTANTAHDVADDMIRAEFEHITMVQRGSTYVHPAEWLHAAQDINYNLEIPTAEADRRSYTQPNKITREIVNLKAFEAIEKSPERFTALERAGFKVDRKGDIYDNLYRRFGGHYIDIGTSDRIAKGQIKMKSDSPIERWTEAGLMFKDGSEIQADLIVLCTGFEHDFRNMASKIVGRGVADSMDEFFGIDEEGEVRGAWKLAGHPNLYYAAGDVRQCRWFSRFVALQIQANHLGKPLQPYESS